MDFKKRQAQLNAAMNSERLVTFSVPEEGEKVISGLSSGSMLLNLALSGGPLVGYAWGRIVEIYGPEQSGKTTLALHAIFEAQRLEDQTGVQVPCLFIDMEHALDTSYASRIGINLEKLSLAQPDCGEQGLTLLEKSINLGYKVIVIDSVAALTPKAEIEGEMGDSHMGLQARLMSQACRKLIGVVNKSEALVIFINQIRSKIGVIFGNPEVTPGGKALKFYSSYRLDIRSPRSGAKKSTLSTVGEVTDSVESSNITNVKVVKNKLYPPFRRASFTIEYGKGIDRYSDAIDFLQYAGAFKQQGNSKGDVLVIKSKNKAYSRSKVLSLFREDPEVQADILDMVRSYDNDRSG